MYSLIDTYETDNYKLEIMYSECHDSPRDWCCSSELILFHNRYNIGDDHSYNSSHYSGWDEMYEAIQEDYPNSHIFRVSMYDHSGVSLSVGAPTCMWDSGYVGFAVVDEEIKDEDEAYNIVEGELEIYNHYLNGDCFGFALYEKIYVPEADDYYYKDIDSCGGFLNSSDISQIADYINSDILDEIYEKYGEF